MAWGGAGGAPAWKSAMRGRWEYCCLLHCMNCFISLSTGAVLMLVYIDVASAVRSVHPGGSVKLMTFFLRVVESR
eukprot:6976861-Ditylum_brightwellii.AAC.1